MARDNRKENRQKAKAGNENAAPDGTDFSELLGTDETEEEELSDGLDETKEKDEKEEKEEKEEKTEEEKNADKSEEDEKKAGKEASLDDLSDTKSVDNDDEEEVKKADGTDDKAKDDAKAKEKVGETAEEKSAREAKEEADRVEAEAKKTAPTSEEKKTKEPEKSEATELTDEQAAELFTNWRGETQKLLAEHVYRLTDEDVAELNENPAAYIPKVAARVYLDCISASFQQFVTYLPRMVHQVLEAREGINEQETKFYSAWPQLAAHKDKVLRMGASYRKENPTASMEDFINEVGAQAMVALRLSPEKANGKAAEEKQEQQAGKKGFKPAIDGSASETPPKNRSQNPFDQMSQEWGLHGEELDDS